MMIIRGRQDIYAKKNENRKVLISDNVFNVPFSDDKS